VARGHRRPGGAVGPQARAAAADHGGVERKKLIDEKTVVRAVEQIDAASSDKKDELLTDLLCHVYPKKASQDG
jgi:hypothetical protein